MGAEAVAEARIREIVREELEGQKARRGEAWRELEARQVERLRAAPQFRDGQWHFPAAERAGQ